MKTLIPVLLCFPAILLSAGSSWELKKEDETVLFRLYLDGGSTGIVFENAEGQENELILDKSYEVAIDNPDPDNREFQKKKDGLLYWGFDNFRENNPIDINSPFSEHLIDCLKREIDESGDKDTYIEFLEAIKRMRSSQAVLTTPDAARPAS